MTIFLKWKHEHKIPNGCEETERESTVSETERHTNRPKLRLKTVKLKYRNTLMKGALVVKAL